jgi:rod shape determining protein RodA
VAGPIIVLVLKQPDLSSVLVMLPVLLAMLFCAGARIEHMAIIVGFGLVASVFPMAFTALSLKSHWAQESRAAAFVLAIPRLRGAFIMTLIGIWSAFGATWWLLDRWRVSVNWIVPVLGALIVSAGLVSGIVVDHHLKTYQRKRIETFLAPENDPRGSSYNLLQAQIALGSGGLWGRGFFSGTQSQLGFLPERHTDFIFAVVGEEMGLWGSLSIMILYLLIIWRMVSAARTARDRFGYLVACGLAASFGCYLLANTGMCLGFLPIAGLELPLVSYGGSNLVASLWALGIVESIYSRRYAFYQG